MGWYVLDIFIVLTIILGILDDFIYLEFTVKNIYYSSFIL